MTGNQGELDPFADGGEHRESGEVWPNANTRTGDAMMGVLRRIRTVQGKEGPYEMMTFGPVVIRAGKVVAGYKAIAVPLSATLRSLLGVEDKGKTIALVFQGKADGKRYWNYAVHEQTRAKLLEMLRKAGAPAEILGSLETERKDDDDLPF